MRRTNADTTTPHFYICNPLRFLDEAAVHGGRTRNVAHGGRARRRRGNHLDLYRKSIRPLLLLSCSYRWPVFVVSTPTFDIEVKTRGRTLADTVIILAFILDCY
jgi:hypothetical protein